MTRHKSARQVKCSSVSVEIQMRIENIECEDSKYVLSQLRGRVFHLTTQESYARILETGKISNNKSEQFRVNTSSENSYGRLQGYVCLFDLRYDTPEIIRKTLDCYYFLGPSWFEKYRDDGSQWDLVYLLLNSKYYDRLIPNTVVHDHYKKTGKYLQWIPGTEVWVEDHVPLNWIDTTLVVTIKHPPPDLSTPVGQHIWAVRSADKEER